MILIIYMPNISIYFRHFEKKCQKELEEEGDEYADKETFVTSSYKKKLAVIILLRNIIKTVVDIVWNLPLCITLMAMNFLELSETKIYVESSKELIIIFYSEREILL